MGKEIEGNLEEAKKMFWQVTRLEITLNISLKAYFLQKKAKQADLKICKIRNNHH